MARLYANENFPRQVVEALGTAGHDVLTVQEAGNAGQSIGDENVLTFATQNDRAVLTLDRRDFIRLHRSRPDHAGIIACTQDDDTEGRAERIHQAIASVESLAGQLCELPARRSDAGNHVFRFRIRWKLAGENDRRREGAQRLGRS